MWENRWRIPYNYDTNMFIDYIHTYIYIYNGKRIGNLPIKGTKSGTIHGKELKWKIIWANNWKSLEIPALNGDLNGTIIEINGGPGI